MLEWASQVSSGRIQGGLSVPAWNPEELVNEPIPEEEFEVVEETNEQPIF